MTKRIDRSIERPMPSSCTTRREEGFAKHVWFSLVDVRASWTSSRCCGRIDDAQSGHALGHLH
eukprot:scaffold1684_cov214-Amphora_coffeaeformis.AAC.21